MHFASKETIVESSTNEINKVLLCKEQWFDQYDLQKSKLLLDLYAISKVLHNDQQIIWTFDLFKHKGKSLCSTNRLVENSCLPIPKYESDSSFRIENKGHTREICDFFKKEIVT